MGAAPSVSIIVPVLNEADDIQRSMACLRELGPDSIVEIIVVDGDARGSTIQSIKVKGVNTVVAEKGRARQMNRGASLASGEILLFLHADTLLPSKAVGLIQAAMDDKRFAAGAFDLGIDSARRIFRITEKYVALRTRLTRVPYGDQAIFIRRGYFKKVGGYRDIPLMEDVDLMKRMRKRGDRICIIPAMVRTSPRRYEKEGIVYGTVRNWMLQLLFTCGVSPKRLAKWYKS